MTINICIDFLNNISIQDYIMTELNKLNKNTSHVNIWQP